MLTAAAQTPDYGAIPFESTCSGDCTGTGGGPIDNTTEEWQTGSMASNPVDGTVLAYTQDAVISQFSGSYEADTWSFDGTSWTLLHTDWTSPDYTTTITDTTLARDSIGVVRVEPCGSVECLYRWTGSTWQLQHPAASPPPRSFANVAYNDRSGRMVLFGGWGIPTCTTDTWTWDGTSWSQESNPVHPGCAAYQSMARDPISGMVLFDPAIQATWRHDSTGWHQLATAHVPPRGSTGKVSLTWDRASGTVVMLIAPTMPRNTASTTWTWDGRDWTNRALGDATSPGLAPSAMLPRTGQTVAIASANATYLWTVR